MKNLKEILKLIPVLYDRRNNESEKISILNSNWIIYYFNNCDFLSLKENTTRQISGIENRKDYYNIYIVQDSKSIVIDGYDMSELEPDEIFQLSLEHPNMMIYDEIKYLIDNFIDCQILIDKQFSTELYDSILDFCGIKK